VPDDKMEMFKPVSQKLLNSYRGRHPEILFSGNHLRRDFLLNFEQSV